MRSEIARRAEAIALSVVAHGTRQDSEPWNRLSLKETGSVCCNSPARDVSNRLKSRNPNGLNAVVNGVFTGQHSFGKDGLYGKRIFR